MRLSIFAGDDRHEAATIVGGPALLAASTTAVARAVLLIGVILSQVIGPSPLTTQAADALTTATGPPTYVYDSPSASTTHTSNARIDPARERGATAGHMWSSTFLISRGHATKVGDDVAGATPRMLGPGTNVGAKIQRQLPNRGWTQRLVQSTIDNPARTVTTRDTRHLAGGGRADDPATAFYGGRGGYVVRNNRSGDVVQVSDRTNPNWSAPWDQ